MILLYTDSHFENLDFTVRIFKRFRKYAANVNRIDITSIDNYVIKALLEYNLSR